MTVGKLEFGSLEYGVLKGVAGGLRNKEIAASVGTTELVVKNYVRRLFDKTGMSTRIELALWCVAKEGGTCG
jgi:DNA-binding NarL/FixJ family response regulator